MGIPPGIPAPCPPEADTMRSKFVMLRLALLLILTALLIAGTAVAAFAQRTSWVV
jgi:hypothetical protein